MRGVNPELLKGSVAVLVLSTLKKRPMYGYELIKEISSSSAGALNLAEGTLYPILHEFEKQGMLESVWLKEKGRARKYYRLSKDGKAALKSKQAEWTQFRQAVESVLLGPQPPSLRS